MEITMIVVVAELCRDDPANVYFIDLLKLDQSNPEEKEYYDKCLNALKTGDAQESDYAFSYGTVDNDDAFVNPPCMVQGSVEMYV